MREAYSAARAPARARGSANPPIARALAAPVKVGGALGTPGTLGTLGGLGMVIVEFAGGSGATVVVLFATGAVVTVDAAVMAGSEESPVTV